MATDDAGRSPGDGQEQGGREGEGEGSASERSPDAVPDKVAEARIAWETLQAEQADFPGRLAEMATRVSYPELQTMAERYIELRYEAYAAQIHFLRVSAEDLAQRQPQSEEDVRTFSLAWAQLHSMILQAEQAFRETALTRFMEENIIRMVFATMYSDLRHAQHLIGTPPPWMG